jgi:hypothetical protein
MAAGIDGQTDAWNERGRLGAVSRETGAYSPDPVVVDVLVTASAHDSEVRGPALDASSLGVGVRATGQVVDEPDL